MKKYLAVIMIGIGLMIGACSCASSGASQSPPSKLDQELFTINTNWIPNVVVKTNVITQTNIVTVTTTNPVTQVVFATNETHVTVTGTNIVSETNQVPVYVYSSPSQVASATISTASALGGPWGAVAGALATGILAIWGGLKNKKLNTTTTIANSGVQAIETARNVISSLPNGAALSAQYDSWLKSHQNAAGIATEVATLVDKVVNTSSGQAAGVGAASQILAAAASPLGQPAKA